MKSTVLVIDDDPLDSRPLCLLLGQWDLEVVTARSGEEGLARLASTPVDLVISDVYMPGLTGEQVVERIAREHPDLPVILLTGRGDVKSAVRAMRLGAFDYVLKPPAEDELRFAVQRALEQARLRRENRFLRAELGALGPHGERLIGRSAPMLEVFDLIRRVARTDSTVLITGETGTGKELLAQTIHFKSARAGGPFVAFNCAAINPNLVESELFGHEKGAFTGAVAARRGRFEEAHGGTLFLDEIGETTPEFQVKLLRVLQEREFQRVGGSERIRVDARVLASTNRDLAQLVKAGRFREDLYYRLRVIPIHLPPLRERREDILPLADSFLEGYRAQYGLGRVELSAGARARLAAAPWPGNVRELQYAVERAVVLARGPVLEADDFEAPAPAGAPAPVAATLDAHLEGKSRAYLVETLDRLGWNKSRAAQALGMDRTTLHRMLRKFQLERGG